MASSPPTPKLSELARIKSLSGEDYQLTPRDAEWAFRLVAFEGGDPATVLWTMAQRWVLLREQAKRAGNTGYTTFAAMLRGFSQPLDPDWAATGKHCRPGGDYAGKSNCSAAALARRKTAQTAPLSAIFAKDPEAYSIAIAWLQAAIPNPVSSGTNFADQGVAEAYLAANPNAKELARTPANACPQCNVIIRDPGARSWVDNHVWLATRNGAIASAAGTQNGPALERFASGLWSNIAGWWQS